MEACSPVEAQFEARFSLITWLVFSTLKMEAVNSFETLNLYWNTLHNLLEGKYSSYSLLWEPQILPIETCLVLHLFSWVMQLYENVEHTRILRTKRMFRPQDRREQECGESCTKREFMNINILLSNRYRHLFPTQIKLAEREADHTPPPSAEVRLYMCVCFT
jgi:hypothetical protein